MVDLALPDVQSAQTAYRRRMIIEFQDFDDGGITSRHIKMLLTAFDIKSATVDYIVRLWDSTPFIRELLPWSLIIDTLSSIADPASIRFGALDPVLTRRDLEDMQDRTSDFEMLYAPTRFVVFEFTPFVHESDDSNEHDSDEDDSEEDENEEDENEAKLREVIEGELSATILNSHQSAEGPPIKLTTLETIPVGSPSSTVSVQALKKASQEYLDEAASNGIGARRVWAESGGTGRGIRYVDIEYSWLLHHPDLPEIRDPYDGTYSYKLDREPERNHGTGMLGVISAQHNSQDTYGIAPDAEAYVLSRLRASNIDNLPGAITTACCKILRPGDVLLIEAQYQNSNREFVPAQANPAVFAAIRFGVSLGVIIVAPAGNSGLDLASHGDFPAIFHDSGAILVAAAKWDNGGFARWVAKNSNLESNYGANVVDCFAWGGDMGGLTSKQPVTMTFDEGATSGAAAIIAGVAILVQSLYRAKFPDGSVIWPEEMRQLLRDQAMSAAQVDDIGVMPNLQSIFKDNLDSGRQPATRTDKKSVLDKFARALGWSDKDNTQAPRDADLPLLTTFRS